MPNKARVIAMCDTVHTRERKKYVGLATGRPQQAPYQFLESIQLNSLQDCNRANGDTPWAPINRNHPMQIESARAAKRTKTHARIARKKLIIGGRERNAGSRYDY